MNKFKMWHLALISLAVFLVFGIIATAAIASNAALKDTSIWDFNLNRNVFNLSFGGGKDYTIDTQKDVNVSEAKDITVGAVSAEINIIQTVGDTLSAHLYGDYNSRSGEIELEVKQTGSTVKINVKYPTIGIRSANLTLDIQIPESYSGSFEIGTVSSSVKLECEDISFEEVSLNTVSGRISIGTLNSEKLNVNTTSGRVSGTLSSGDLKANSVSGDFELSDISGYADIDTVSGKVELDIKEYEGVKVDSTSGNVTISFASAQDFYVKYDTVSGDFDCSLPLMIEKQDRTSIDAYSGNANAAVIDVNTVSGDLKINQ